MQKNAPETIITKTLLISGFSGNQKKWPKKKKLSKNILSENDLDKIVDRALSKEKQTGDNTIIPQRQEKSFLKRMFNRK